MPIRPAAAVMLLAALTVAAVLFILSGISAAHPAGAARSGRSPTNPSPNQIESLSDELFEKYMNRDGCGLSGGLLSVVCSDSTVFSKGYGFARIAEHVPFDPSGSQIRVASVAKLITVTAVMQLVERGIIGLDDMIGDHLGELRTANDYGVPVTIRHLLTHTAGFENRSIGIEFRDAGIHPNLASYLERELPPIVWRPGSIYNYSDHGTAVLALIVERAASMPFFRYARRNIFDPLGMTRTSFRHDFVSPDEIMTRYGCPESGGTGKMSGLPWSGTKLIGAAGLTTTATDMEIFMRSYLACATYGFETILRESSVNEIFWPQFRYKEGLNRRIGYMWHIERREGVDVYYHIGDAAGIASYLALIPDLDIGLFLLCNHDSGNDLRRELADRFFEQFLQESSADPAQWLKLTDPEILTGEYLPAGLAGSSIEKLFRLSAYRLKVERGIGDTLTIDNRRYLEIERALFEQVGGDDRIYFFEDDEGRSFCTRGLRTYRKIDWYESRTFHTWLPAACALLLVSSFIWPARRRTERSRVRVWAENLLASAGFLQLLFLLLIYAALSPVSLIFGVPMWIKLLFVLPIVAMILAAPSLICALTASARSGTGAVPRIHYSLVLIAFITMTYCLGYWNLLGFRF